MFTSIKQRFARLLLAAGVIFMLTSAPIIPVASAADCASTSSGTSCSG
jgi:hypothetical protein